MKETVEVMRADQKLEYEIEGLEVGNVQINRNYDWN